MNVSASSPSGGSNSLAVTIQNVTVPSLGFGTFQLKGENCADAVRHALSVGYRHVDTARMYQNEADVGRAVKDSGVNREDLFITSKIWQEDCRPEKVSAAVESSLHALKTDFLDLLLIHWPEPDIPLQETLGAMRAQQAAGHIRKVGVSNFPPSLLLEALSDGPIFCNQVEYHPLLGQTRVLEICREHDVLLAAYAPLAHGKLIDHGVLAEIGAKHGKSASQTALRWLLQQDHVVALPRSSKPTHITENFMVNDFELDRGEMSRIDALPKNQRFFNPPFAPDWES